ncbi:MAG: hypothetical protein ACP5M8_06885 [Caldisphaera sp.]|jgi:uncharacterized membrane protein
MIDNNLKNVAAGFFIVIAIIFSINFFMSYWRPGPYSLLALLNQNKELGGYPREVPVNSTLNLYVYIENHENILSLYEVKIYVVNASFVVNSKVYPKGKPYYTFYDLIENSKNDTIPFSLSFNKEGDYKIVVLLYIYNGTGFEFTGLYNQLYINSTV